MDISVVNDNNLCLYLNRLIQEGRGVEVVSFIKSISLAGRAARQAPTIFALAVCARCNDARTKEEAYKAVLEVCRIPTHLFMFVKYCEQQSSGTGWGRAHRRAIIMWYKNKCKNPLKASRLVTKYKNREGYSHCDVLRLAHPKPEDETTKILFKFITYGRKGMDELLGQEVNLVNDKTKNMIAYLRATDEARKCTDEDKMAELITEYSLEREHVTTQLLNSKKVWEALIENLKMEATVRNLGKITSLGLCEQGSWVEQALVSRLTDQKLLKSSRTHPFKILLALNTYRKGHGDKGHLSWTPNQAVLEALDKAFYMAFESVEPTGKRYCLAVDVSGSMLSPCIGSSSITCKMAAAAMMMVTARKETNYDIVAFSHELTPLKINKSMTLETVLKVMDELPLGGTDCALPIIEAQKKGQKYDVFIVYTDSETWYGKVHPARALQEYRDKMNIPDAKLIVVGMASNDFTIADPDDFGMLDIVGFDSGATETIAKFSLGTI